MEKTLVEEVAVSISTCGSKSMRCADQRRFLQTTRGFFDERLWLDVTQFAQSSARNLAPSCFGSAASLTSRVTFLWGDWNAHSAMDSKASFQRVSLTQATAVDTRRQSASTYVVAAPEFNLCGCSPTRPPAACHCSKSVG